MARAPSSRLSAAIARPWLAPALVAGLALLVHLGALRHGFTLDDWPLLVENQRMEEEGIIRARVALLDPTKVDASVTVFIAIKTDQHNSAWSEKFAFEMSSIPEIMEIYRMSGEVDYLLRVVVPDIAAFDNLYKKIIDRIALSNVTSSFAIEQMKYTTALPV